MDNLGKNGLYLLFVLKWGVLKMYGWSEKGGVAVGGG